MEAHVRIYSHWQHSKRELVYGGLGLIPWVKAHPILTAALAYGAYKAWPYLGDNWLFRNLGRAASAGAAVGGAVSDVAETISQQPENFQQLARAGVELGETVGEIGLNLVQGTVETAQEMGQGAVRAGDFAVETVVLGLDNLGESAAKAAGFPATLANSAVHPSLTPLDAAGTIVKTGIPLLVKGGFVLGAVAVFGVNLYKQMLFWKT